MRKFLVLIVLMLVAIGTKAQVPVALSPVPAQQFFSATGVPLAGGCVFSYISGTSTPLATYIDGTGLTQNTNPVILDGGGFGNIWLSNASYRFSIYSTGGVNCATGTFQRTVDNVSAYTIINQAQNLFLSGQTSDPSGSAGELIYRSDIPCFRAFTTLWDCLVTLTAVQAMTNKTLTSSTFNGGVVSSSTITFPTISAPTINGAVAGSSLQGTDTKLLSAGTVTGTGALLCTDANGGASTSGCPSSLAQSIYTTASGATTGSIGTINMVTAGGSGNKYVFSAQVTQTAAGTSCTGSSGVTINIIYTDSVTGSAINVGVIGGGSVGGSVSSIPSLALTGNGSIGNTIWYFPTVINAKASTVVSYSTTYTVGSGCSPAPQYYVTPALVQVQ